MPEITHEKLTDRIFFRFDQQGEPRLVQILRLATANNTEIAICMLGDCDTSETLKKLLVCEFSSQGIKDIEEYSYDKGGLVKAIEYHKAHQNKLSDSEYFRRLINLQDGDLGQVGENGLEIATGINSFIELQLKSNFIVKSISTNTPLSQRVKISNLSVEYDNGTDEYESFTPVDVCSQLLEIKASDLGSELQIDSMTIRIYALDPTSIIENDEEKPAPSNFSAIHYFVDSFVDEVNASFDMVIDNKDVQEVGPEDFNIQAFGKSNYIHEDDDEIDDED